MDLQRLREPVLRADGDAVMGSRIARLGRTLIAALGFVAVMTFAQPGSPALADEVTGSVLISFDGTNFSTNPTGNIFDTSTTFIPGTTQTARFWVKNGTNIPADLNIGGWGELTSDTALIDSLTLQASTGANETGPEIPIQAGTCRPILNSVRLSPGQSKAVLVSLSMSRDVTDQTAQGTAAGMSLSISLTEAAAEVSPDHCVGISSGPLPTAPASSDSSNSAAGGTGSGTGSGNGRGTGSSSISSSFGGSLDINDPDSAAVGDPIKLQTLAVPGGESTEDQNSDTWAGLLFGGTAFLYPALMAGSLLIGAGICLVLIRRRRRAEES